MREYVLVQEGQEASFIARAEELGVEELVLLYEKPPQKEVADKKSLKILSGLVGTKKSSANIQIVLGTSFNGWFSGLTHVGELELIERKDSLHQRRSGLNHVLLAEFKKKNVCVLFSYSLLQKRNLIGRMMQNVMLCKKAEVKTELVSLARKPEDIRHPRDVAALGRILGL